MLFNASDYYSHSLRRSNGLSTQNFSFQGSHNFGSHLDAGYEKIGSAFVIFGDLYVVDVHKIPSHIGNRLNPVPSFADPLEFSKISSLKNLLRQSDYLQKTQIERNRAYLNYEISEQNNSNRMTFIKEEPQNIEIDRVNNLIIKKEEPEDEVNNLYFHESPRKKVKTEESYSTGISNHDVTSRKHEINKLPQKPSRSKRDKTKGKTPKKLQSKWKNIPGHIIFAIQRGVMNYFNHSKGIHIGCISRFLESKSKEEQNRLQTFIANYQTCWKTWDSIIEFIDGEDDDGMRQMLIELISQLLSSSNSIDFEGWLEKTKMTDHTKELIRSNKTVFKDEFIERINKSLGIYNL